MLIDQDTLRGIAGGRVTVQYRRWKRPTVKAGGTLLTSIGQLAIESVDQVDVGSISNDEARAAGFPDVSTLRHALDRRGTEAPVYRVCLRLAGPDPRVALRGAVPDEVELEAIRSRLSRWDAASPIGPWTVATLEVIEARPETRAGDLAGEVGLPKDRFKTNVRKLKGLGLTESLEIGYRLSSRGRVVLRSLVESAG